MRRSKCDRNLPGNLFAAAVSEEEYIWFVLLSVDWTGVLLPWKATAACAKELLP
jgi:hypothetical protein